MARPLQFLARTKPTGLLLIYFVFLGEFCVCLYICMCSLFFLFDSLFFFYLLFALFSSGVFAYLLLILYYFMIFIYCMFSNERAKKM